MPRTNDRGLFEKVKGSDIWWIHYHDEFGRRKRELGGTKAMARNLYDQRKREVLLRGKQPELAAAEQPAVRFAEIMRDALAYSSGHAKHHVEVFRAERMCKWWGPRPAVSITPQEIEVQFASLTAIGHNHRPETMQRPVSNATFNRYRAQLSLAFQLAQRYGKLPLGFNPARLVKLRKEARRVRWLSAEEEKSLRQVIQREYPDKPWLHLLAGCLIAAAGMLGMSQLTGTTPFAWPAVCYVLVGVGFALMVPAGSAAAGSGTTGARARSTGCHGPARLRAPTSCSGTASTPASGWACPAPWASDMGIRRGARIVRHPWRGAGPGVRP